MVDKLGLTKGQIKQFKESFAVFDKNGDGKITPDELGAVMKAIGEPRTPEQLKEMIRRFDADDSGCIDINEFYEMMAGTVGQTEQDVANAFKVFDKDGNGFISRGELKHALRANFGKDYSNDQIEKLIDRVDQDKDGRVNYEEFMDMMNLQQSK